jgi:hypothetical protein
MADAWLAYLEALTLHRLARAYRGARGTRLGAARIAAKAKALRTAQLKKEVRNE